MKRINVIIAGLTSRPALPTAREAGRGIVARHTRQKPASKKGRQSMAMNKYGIDPNDDQSGALVAMGDQLHGMMRRLDEPERVQILSAVERIRAAAEPAGILAASAMMMAMADMGACTDAAEGETNGND